MNVAFNPNKRREWEERARRKNSIVPSYFEISPEKAIIVCGNCGKKFSRNLVFGVNEPVFVCPTKGCNARNWLPVTYKTS
ncbi:MAG: hypothetical protein D6780_03495 [Candidatus Dadabacteria bacterium]|nr:MAG: hypothetical protein D6780_03495 [Candidatus Dadabacteria bacterium]